MQPCIAFGVIHAIFVFSLWLDRRIGPYEKVSLIRVITTSSEVAEYGQVGSTYDICKAAFTYSDPVRTSVSPPTVRLAVSNKRLYSMYVATHHSFCGNQRRAASAYLLITAVYCSPLSLTPLL